MEPIRTEQAFYDAINQDKPTVAVFKTTWCKDCHYIEPFMPGVEKAYADKLSFVQLDRDELPDLCEKYNILGIPSFIGFRRGEELGRFVSKLRKTREEIEQFLDQVVEASQASAK
ncbi:thioredoxin family protein [Paenibacillus flagellatus]|uniref:Thiol reductase thioredoxin n=1 Tax=Paenibacillus flagellatus TaxID=2211139 RepID=A0A2V5K3U3_9BACL|nr:thioredoxin family protein [Paenibacillus flagellatus]PYI53939.1 thiol reductase thioredoxin [Paenibacillus flagellatus]